MTRCSGPLRTELKGGAMLGVEIAKETNAHFHLNGEVQLVEFDCKERLVMMQELRNRSCEDMESAIAAYWQNKSTDCFMA